MSDNIVHIQNVPYLLSVQDDGTIISGKDLSNLKVISTDINNEVLYVPNVEYTAEQIYIQPGTEIFEESITPVTNQNIMEVETVNQCFDPPNAPALNMVYEIVYPEELNLKPASLKRGRPKKKKVVDEKPEESQKTSKPPPRTRSGRVVRFPKHIEKDFTKIEISDDSKNQEELKTTEFEKFEEPVETEKKSMEQMEFHQRKRKISAQYRCPKCQKAYLGKIKMIEHIKKNPSHGPLPEGYNLNFEVWNYLVDVTLKSPTSERGSKFCEELTNMLHNLLLLTNALFKKNENHKNEVQIDKVLGNAIGLPPGQYEFDDSKLYKDVTVLKLITNSEFFKPTVSEANEKKVESESKCNCDKNKKSNANSISDAELTSINKSPKSLEENMTPTLTDVGFYFTENEHNMLSHGFEVNIDNSNDMKEQTLAEPQKEDQINYDEHKDKHRVNTEENVVSNELLSDNSLLSSLPNLRNTVDELVLPGVDTASNILDNSTSSDEVMNVDQFVNERFKKITEPELDLSNTSISLDLPALDLFQFHNS